MNARNGPGAGRQRIKKAVNTAPRGPGNIIDWLGGRTARRAAKTKAKREALKARDTKEEAKP